MKTFLQIFQKEFLKCYSNDTYKFKMIYCHLQNKQNYVPLLGAVTYSKYILETSSVQIVHIVAEFPLLFVINLVNNKKSLCELIILLSIY